MYSNIPDEMKKLMQWVCWSAVSDSSRPGKIKKVPINAKTGGQAQSNNSDTWCSFDLAVTESSKYSGIGFMFDNGYFGVDIDNAEDAIDEYRRGESDNIVAEFINTLGSYSEYSVSGNGIHIICKGSLPEHGRRKNNIEMYQSGRFFIMTGKTASEYNQVSDCTERIKPLHEKHIGGGIEPVKRLEVNQVPLTLNEYEIIQLAENSKQGSFFRALYSGNWQQYYTSQSEADMAFCCILAFWCRCDESLMDSIFRSSGLMRSKWDRKQSGSTYGQVTLEKAIKGCVNVYEPKEPYHVIIGEKTVEIEQIKLFSFDDTGNADRMVFKFGELIRYSYVNKSWFYYDGRKWCQDITGAVKRMADNTVESVKLEREAFLQAQPSSNDLEEMGKVFDKFLKSCRSNKSKTAMLKETEHRVPITPDKFDIHKHLLNTPNGIINLKSGELMEHDKNYYLTKIAHTEYTDKIDAPLWNQFLNDIFNGDTELITFIQKAVGYSLSGSTKEDCAFFCYGTGRNGKSTFLDIVSTLMGEYATNIQPESIMVKNASSGPTSDIARLKGARFVTTAEPNEGVRLNEGLVKQLTGGDKITASKKYENEFEFYPEFKLWMSTNHKPVIRGTDIGIWSRIRLIPFTVRIPDEKMDKNLKHKLKQEMTGILKWAVDGCLLWQRDGLKSPKAILDATSEYKSEMDVLAAFIEECCTVCSGREQTKVIYQAYKEWASKNNEYEMPGRKFAREMLKRFERQRAHGIDYYKSVMLADNSGIGFGD